MAWPEHQGGNKYKLVTRDLSKVNHPKRSITVEVPPDIARSARKTERWLAVELEKWEEIVRTGQVVPRKRRPKSEKISFESFVPKWEQGYAKGNLGDYTRKNYKDYLEQSIVPVFGTMLIEKITTLQIVEFLADLKRKDGKEMATNTKLNIYKALKSVLDCAFDWGIIKENPIERVKRPSAAKKEKKTIRAQKKAYNWDEVQQIIVAMYELPTRWRLYFTGVILGGFRRGEYLAPEWTDVDYERAAIWIDKQITFDEKGNKIEGEVKTEESEGWVPMPRWYMDQLKEYEREWKKEKLQCKDWKGGDKRYIFHPGDGTMYYPNTPSVTWRKFLKKQGLPHVKLHGLRHTAGMILRESGVDLKTIQERLRHTKIGTTADIYTHESAQISRAAADRLEILNPKNKKIAPQTAP